VLPITYATFSALFGTFSVVLAKVLSELVTLQAEGTNIFWGADAWFTYVTLVGWLGFVGVWLFRMNEALSLYDPLFIIPLLQVNFILFAIVSGTHTMCTHVSKRGTLPCSLIVDVRACGCIFFVRVPPPLPCSESAFCEIGFKMICVRTNGFDDP
jgi:hypothetical protein